MEGDQGTGKRGNWRLRNQGIRGLQSRLSLTRMLEVVRKEKLVERLAVFEAPL